MMRDVEEEREILRLQQVRIIEESKTNPDVLLSPREMALKCVGKVTDFEKMYKEYRVKDELVTDNMNEEIFYAMNRQGVLGVPMFKQDFAYRLIKLNQIDNTMWKTDFIKKVYKMVEDLDSIEADNAIDGNSPAQQREKEVNYSSSRVDKPKKNKNVKVKF